MHARTKSELLGYYYITASERKIILDFNAARQDGMAVAPYANHFHLAFTEEW